MKNPKTTRKAGKKGGRLKLVSGASGWMKGNARGSLDIPPFKHHGGGGKRRRKR